MSARYINWKLGFEPRAADGRCTSMVAALFSVTILGYFWKFSGTNFLSKEAKKFGYFLGCFEKCHSLNKASVATFWATYGNNWATLNSSIWSPRPYSTLTLYLNQFARSCCSSLTTVRLHQQAHVSPRMRQTALIVCRGKDHCSGWSPVELDWIWPK